MQLGAGLDGLDGEYEVEQKLGLLAELRVDFAEATLRSTQGPEDLRRLAESADRAGVQIRSAVLDEFVRLPSDPQALAAVSRLLEPVAILGCDVVLLPVKLGGGGTIAYENGVDELAGPAEDLGLRLGLEFVGGTPPALVAELVRRIGRPAVGMYFDVGNCLHAGVDPLASLREALDLVVQIHLKGGPETPLAAMRLDRVGSLLAEGGYGGRVCLELEPPRRSAGLRDAVGVARMYGFGEGAS